MKLLELQLRAFGPFTDSYFDFSAGDLGFHMLFGSNEAGKSSALRALRAFLYGIPNNTLDNFLHANQTLRLGGRLRHSDGTELSVVRRKGQKSTLESADGHTLPDTVLAPFLAGVNEQMFSTMFGLTHEALIAGGREMLTGGGEVGQSLFSAAGGINLRQLHQQLEHEARALYLPTGQNPRVNKALVTYKAMKQTIEAHSLAGGKWEEHQQRLATTLAEQQRVREELARLATEKSRLDRLHAIMPAIARRMALVTKRQDFLGVASLPPAFAEQRREAVQKIEQARVTQDKSQRALEQLSMERQALYVPQALLDQAEAITLLQQRLGGHEKAAHDRLKLDGQRRQLDTDIEALLAQLPPTLARAHEQTQRLQARHRARIQALAQQYQACVDRKDRATKDVQKYAAQRTKTLDALQALPTLQDLSALRRAVAQARQQGDLEAARDQECTALQAEVDQAQVEITQMGLWSGTLEELECLAVPSRETVDQVETTFNALNAHANHLRQTIRQTHDELAELDQQLSILHRTGTVPSEEALTRARDDRTQLWQQVQCLWLDEGMPHGGADMPQTPRDLAEAYVDSVSHADEVADRLRREAERVTRQATLLAQHERVTTTLQQLALEREILDATRHQEQQQWHSLWQSCGITPHAARAMRAWLDRHGQLVQRAARVRQHRHQLSRIYARLQAHDTAIRQELAGLGEHALADGVSLNTMLERSEALLEAIDDAVSQRDQLGRQLSILESELEEAQPEQREASEQLTRWHNDWAAVVIHLGLHDEATPVEATALLEVLDELVKKQNEVNGLTQRIVGIDRDIGAFTQTVASLVAQIAPDLADMPAVQAAVQLQTRLQKGQFDAARQNELEKQITDQQTTLQEAQSTIAGMTERLHTLCRQAGCTTPDDLLAAEIRSAEFQQLQKDIIALEDQLLEQGAGATLDQLIQDADTVDPDALPAQISEIGRQLDALYAQRSQLDEAKGREEVILHEMDGSGRAADAAEQAQAVVAEIREGVHRYVRLRLASLLLNREIERFRASHQGPILSRASALFAQLTLGSFMKLTTEYNDKDQPVLEGVRANDRQVSVDGMSDGTRDQLYLALRLASLEHYVASNEPLPFIVDDILIQFDDQRAKVALQVLAQLSTRLQVIFFTHHYRLIELVQELQGPHVVQIHKLEPK